MDEISSDWNYAVSYLEFFFNDLQLASGSGFFWESSTGHVFLVSNWHNFSGRKGTDGTPLSKTGGIPNNVKFLAYQKTSAPDAQGRFSLNITTSTIPLVHEKTGNNLWYEHPKLGRNVDIAAIDVTNIRNFNHLVKGVNTLETDSAKQFYVSQDVFVVGYPLGLVAANIPIPVWKRGTIATEPYINPDKKPLVYIDAATRKGMSGSIVIAKDTALGQYPKKDGTLSNTLISLHTQILGIYSGRLYPSHVRAQLGIVWKRALIDELVAARKVAVI